MLGSCIKNSLFTLCAIVAGVFAGYIYDSYSLRQVSATQTVSLDGAILINSSDLKSLVSQDNDDHSILTSHLRAELIRYLWSEGFSNFTKIPYDNGNGILQRAGETGFLLTQPITQTDDVQSFVDRFVKQGNRRQGFIITDDQVSQFDNVFLFRNQKDLELLGYEVVSSRSRVSTDEAYRRHNIKQAFDMMGGIRVVNSGSLSFMSNIGYDPHQRVLYKNGNAIVNGLIKPVYAGGICGASTALFQGLLTNQALEFDVVNHSKRYSKLYSASINDHEVSIPGLDATVFRPTIDFRIKNTRDYPVIIAMNFDGESASNEEVFSLAMPQDIGSFSYQKKYTRGRYSCYVWTINNKTTTSCYDTIY